MSKAVNLLKDMIKQLEKEAEKEQETGTEVTLQPLLTPWDLDHDVLYGDLQLEREKRITDVRGMFADASASERGAATREAAKGGLITPERITHVLESARIQC